MDNNYKQRLKLVLSSQEQRFLNLFPSSYLLRYLELKTTEQNRMQGKIVSPHSQHIRRVRLAFSLSSSCLSVQTCFGLHFCPHETSHVLQTQEEDKLFRSCLTKRLSHIHILHDTRFPRVYISSLFLSLSLFPPGFAVAYTEDRESVEWNLQTLLLSTRD